MPVWARILYKYGVPSAIALFLVWFIAGQLNKNVQAINEKMDHIGSEVHDHVFQTNFYQHSICVMTAKQSGQPISLCDPPQR